LLHGVPRRLVKHLLPALVALAPMPVLGAASSASSRARHGERAYQRVTEGNRHALDLTATDASAVDAGFGAFTVAPAPTDSKPPVEQDDKALRAVLSGGDFQALKKALGSSHVSNGSGSARLITTADNAPLTSFAGKPQFSGTCRSTFYCSSDGGQLCSYFSPGPTSCVAPVPPRVASIILEGAPAPTATSVTFMVQFSEWMFNTDLTGGNSVTTDDFVLATTGGASGTVALVEKVGGTPAGFRPNSRYRITVNALAGNGTIRLDLRPNTNIVDANPRTIFGQVHGAGGPFGNGNAGFTAAFTTGSVHTVALNSAPTGAVTIDGAPSEDQTLTANTSTLADANGLGPFSYQWRRGGVPIVGATSSTYTLGDADVGAMISVTVSYIDGQSNPESVTSAAVGPVANVNDVPTGTVMISGTATEDQTLTASNTLADDDGLGPISYQWRRGGVPIVGATASSYLLGDADVGALITVTASYTDGQNTPESVTSAAVGPVANINDVPTGGITISGTATEDQTLTAVSTLADDDGLGPLNYQWRRDGVPIVGATASSYLLGDADVGAVMSVVVTYTDQQGTAEGPFVGGPTAPVANVNDPPTGSVTISGTATEDQTLTASNTLADDDGLGPISYQWNRGGVPIVGATASSYLLGDADVGALITVTASYTDGQSTPESVTSAAVGPVANINDVPTGGITISGTATEDQTLTGVSTLADGDGLGALNYQWRRDGVDVPGATASSYLLGDADVGAVMSVVVTYTDQLGTAEGPFVGGPTAPVANVNDAPTGSVTISGTATEDQTLTASNTLADDDGLGPISYQWNRGGVPIVGATTTSYLLGDADVGALITVTASYTDGQGTPESVTSAAVGPVANINDLPTGTVTISGTATEDQTLTASNSLADDDGLGPISYQWNRGGVPIVGATASSYLLGDADVGALITVTASYTDGQSTPESVTSAAVGPVANINDVPTGGITISGTVEEDQILTAVSTLADADGLGPLNYQWRRDGVDVPGGTASTYLLGDADVGAAMSVVVTYTDQQGTAEGPFVGGPTAPVANVNDAPTGTVTISGMPLIGAELTLISSLDDPDGIGPLLIQWLRDGQPIAGATQSSYRITLDDVGALIAVDVRFVDGFGTLEGPFVSAGIGPIQAPAIPVPTISGLGYWLMALLIGLMGFTQRRREPAGDVPARKQ
jgi:nitrous oxide reductase accessory protein NosL